MVGAHELSKNNNNNALHFFLHFGFEISLIWTIRHWRGTREIRTLNLLLEKE